MAWVVVVVGAVAAAAVAVLEGAVPFVAKNCGNVGMNVGGWPRGGGEGVAGGR